MKRFSTTLSEEKVASSLLRSCVPSRAQFRVDVEGRWSLLLRCASIPRLPPDYGLLLFFLEGALTALTPATMAPPPRSLHLTRATMRQRPFVGGCCPLLCGALAPFHDHSDFLPGPTASAPVPYRPGARRTDFAIAPILRPSFPACSARILIFSRKWDRLPACLSSHSLPCPSPRPFEQVRRGLSYGDKPRNFLDVYFPPDDSAPAKADGEEPDKARQSVCFCRGTLRWAPRPRTDLRNGPSPLSCACPCVRVRYSAPSAVPSSGLVVGSCPSHAVLMSTSFSCLILPHCRQPLAGVGSPWSCSSPGACGLLGTGRGVRNTDPGRRLPSSAASQRHNHLHQRLPTLPLARAPPQGLCWPSGSRSGGSSLRHWTTAIFLRFAPLTCE